MTSAESNRRITSLASDRAVHRAFTWLHLHEKRFRQWQHELLAIPAPPFGEAPRARWFAERFTELGLCNVHIDSIGNALAELPSQPGSREESSTQEKAEDESSQQQRPVLLSGGSHREPQSKDPEGAPAPNPERSPLDPGPWALDPDHRPDPDPGADSPVILLSAHLDTVFPAGTPTTPRDDGPRILCPGATDNGAGLTALLALAAALREARINPAVTLLLAANVGEEGEGDLRGMRHLFTASPYAQRIRAVIALEGAGASTVVDRALGARRLRVEITGPGGHSWADFGRPNPILALAGALTRTTQIPRSNHPRTTLNCGTITGGTSVNSIPAKALADLDLRSTDTASLDALEQQILSTLSEAVQAETLRSRPHDSLRLQVRRIGDRTPGALSPKSPLYLSLRAVDRHLHLTTEPRVGSTDANLPLSLGIPALAIGAGGAGGNIHTLDEWHDPTGRELALRRILLLLLDTCTLAARNQLLHSGT